MVRFKAGAGPVFGRVPLNRFHPTMVRFKGVVRVGRRVFISVSIPLWCDLKLGLAGRRAPLFGVSIPLWCDLKIILAA